MDALERLKAALPSDEQKRDKFARWLEAQAQSDGLDVRDLTAAERDEYQQEFERELLAEVSPLDLIEVSRSVKTPDAKVVDLKLGGIRAKKTRADGTPNAVFIRANDLKHLLSLAG